MSEFFGLLAGVTVLITYSLYFRQTLKGQSTPNPSTWAIWLIVGILNSFTYFSVVHENLWQSLIVIMVTISVIVVFIYSAFKSKFSKLSQTEIIAFVLALLIGIYWQLTANDRLSNLLLQVIYIISYIPTIIGIIRGHAKEHYMAWVIAALAYVFTTTSLILDPPGDWIAFVHPVINGIVGNSFVAILILSKELNKNKTL
jgi:hypothetical protein